MVFHELIVFFDECMLGLCLALVNMNLVDKSPEYLGRF